MLIGTLPGMTAEIAAALRAEGFETVADIVRGNPDALARQIPGLDAAAFRGWMSIGRLMEVEGVRPAFALALMAAGIDSLDELASRPLARLRTIADTAADDGPGFDDDALVRIIRDATRIACLGVLNGTLVDCAGAPVAAASIACHGMRVPTDAHGRFRLVRLALGQPLTLTARSASGHEKLWVNLRASPPGAFTGVTIRLPRRPRRPRRLSQLAGDRLPEIGSAAVRSRVEEAPPSADDVLRLLDPYANGDWRAVSRFLDFEGGGFMMRVYRLTAADLPAEAAALDDLVWRSGAWTRARICAEGMARRIEARRRLRRWKPEPLGEAALARSFALLSGTEITSEHREPPDGR